MAVSLSINIVQVAQSVEWNYTNIRVEVIASWTYGSNNRTSPAPTGWLKVNGTTYNFSSTFNNYITDSGSQVIYSVYPVSVDHNADGTKTVTADALFNSGVRSGTVTASATKVLTTIPRAATLTSAPNFNDESNPVINYKNSAGNSVTSLQACIANNNGTTTYAAYRDINKTGTSYTFNLTAAERTALQSAAKNSNTLAVRFYIKTVIGSNTFYNYLDKTLTIINAAPTLAPTVTDIASHSTSLTGDANKVIKGYNYMQVSSNATAKKQAYIVGYKITCGAKSITTASGRLDFVESGTFTFSVTDSRGNTTTQTITKELVNYIKLTCNLAATAPTTDGVMSFTISGNYFNGSFGLDDNFLQLQYRFKEEGGEWSNWTNTGTVITGNTYKTTREITGLDYRKNYTIQARAQDAIHAGGSLTEPIVYSAEKKVKTTPIFDWGENDFAFNVPVSYSGNKLFYTAGDTISIADATACFAGFVTNGQLDVLFTIPLNKPVFASNFTISGSLLCRGVDGYIKGNNYSADSAINLQGGSGYTINNKQITESGLSILVRFNSAIPYSVNNTPITATPYGTINITFT